MSTTLYDPACHELARHFLEADGKSHTAEEAASLARRIQDAVESWFEDVLRDLVVDEEIER